MIDINGKIVSSKKSKELKISKEAVLEASKTCPDAKEVLKALFPDVFEEKFPSARQYEFVKNIIGLAYDFVYVQDGDVQEKADYLLAQILYSAYPGDTVVEFDEFHKRVFKKYPGKF